MARSMVATLRSGGCATSRDLLARCEIENQALTNEADPHTAFARGFDAIAEAILEATELDIGFVLDAAMRPSGFSGDYYTTSSYPDCNADAGDALRQQKSILAILAYAQEGMLLLGSPEDERVKCKRRYLKNWAATGIPVFMDLTVGYDGHLVFPRTPYGPSKLWGNNASWRTEMLKIQPDDFPGVSFTTWNGYTEGYAVVPTTEFGESGFRWVQRVTRQWFDILPLPWVDFSRSMVTALWQTSPLFLRLFVTDVGGSVWMTWWEPERDWTFWAIPPDPKFEIKMHPGADVTAVWRQPDQHFDLFVTRTDGAVWTIWWDNQVGWRPEGWIELHPEIKMQPGAAVTAVWTESREHLNLFSTDSDGLVWSTWFDADGGRPDGWFLIGDSLTIGPGKTITALWSPAPSTTPHLDLFSIGAQRQVVSAYWEPEIGW